MELLKTGIIYDPEMLDHKARRKHPETPQRIKVIIQTLQQNHILTHPKIDYLPSIHRLAVENQLGLAHQTKYISFCQNLWPKSGHRSDITVLDTYFNQKSEKVARIAAGGLLEGIDNLMQGKWQNGFAIIRPPGHHSGAKNTINGFCVYNNIAIGANYLLQKWKKQRVAIVDWDVHHGDGTQHIMQRNENVLFISIHRHDKGTFYPAGDDGHFVNDGESQAKGTKLNIPLDFVDEKFNQYNFQSPGDNDYIYIFHRIIMPILREFNPEVILISSGFDAANGDPLGGFTVTPNGYYYLTKKILELKKPVLVALEGGYNLEAIKNSALGVVKALLGQEPKEPYKNYLQQPIAQIHLKQLCSIHPIIHDQIDSIITHHSQKWPCLFDNELISYTERVKLNKEKCFGIIQDQSSSDQSISEDQTKDIDEFHNDTRVELVQRKSSEKPKTKKSSQKVKKEEQKKQKKQIQEEQYVATQFYFAAGHLQRFKNFSLNNEKILKWSYQPEIKFFQSDFEEKRFAPKYYGCQNEYIIIENLLYKLKSPIIMDIKISRQSKNPFISQEKQQKQKKKQLKSTADKLAFRISGYTTADFKQGGIMTYSQEQVKNILKIVVDKNNKKLFSDFLTEMIDCLSEVKRKYWGTSIVLIKSQIKSAIRWIDFHYYTKQTETHDEDLIQGLQNLKDFIDFIQ